MLFKKHLIYKEIIGSAAISEYRLKWVFKKYTENVYLKSFCFQADLMELDSFKEAFRKITCETYLSCK